MYEFIEKMVKGLTFMLSNPVDRTFLIFVVVGIICLITLDVGDILEDIEANSNRKNIEVSHPISKWEMYKLKKSIDNETRFLIKDFEDFFTK